MSSALRIDSYTDAERDLLVQKLADRRWRLNNLYTIRDKQGVSVKFVMNSAQENLYDNRHLLNVVLKARQLGFSTFIDIYILDACLWNKDTKAGIIAHHMDDAKAIYAEKIKYPLDNLPPEVRELFEFTTDRAGEVQFDNGSSIRVSTSFRSGTLQILHVSELGKIAAKYPDKAREIRTGAFEAVAQGQEIFVESTAEGREGDFFNLCMKAKALRDSHSTLTPLDFKFHFYPWHENPEYRMDSSLIALTTEDIRYFHDLEGRGIKLDSEQQAWWVKKHGTLQEDIYREHPSYPEEAFKAAVEGAYYGQTITNLRRQGKIGDVPHEINTPVSVCFDLGMNDSTSLWFFQSVGTSLRLIDYYENSGEGIEHYARYLRSLPYNYGTFYMPHDASVRELGSGERRVDTAQKLGIRPIEMAKRPRNQDELSNQIEETRRFLAKCWINETKCSVGLKHLENYRKEWDEKLGTFKSRPRHDAASHGADALRTGAVAYVTQQYVHQQDLVPMPTEDF